MAKSKSSSKKDAPDTSALQRIEATARDVYEKSLKKQKPQLKLPVRALSNVRYKEKSGFFEMANQFKIRTLTYNTVKGFAQTLKMMSISKELIETNDHASKREVYYISKNWGEARFDEQPESDTVMDDIEDDVGES